MKQIYIVILIFMISCTESQPDPVSASYYIINQSNHHVQLIFHDQTKIDSAVVLFNMDSLNFEHNADFVGSLAEPPPFSADSVQVIFDDTIRIVHKRIENQGINRNMFEEDSWDKKQINKITYKFDYIFTEEDYSEAKEK